MNRREQVTRLGQTQVAQRMNHHHLVYGRGRKCLPDPAEIHHHIGEGIRIRVHVDPPVEMHVSASEVKFDWTLPCKSCEGGMPCAPAESAHLGEHAPQDGTESQPAPVHALRRPSDCDGILRRQRKDTRDVRPRRAKTIPSTRPATLWPHATITRSKTLPPCSRQEDDRTKSIGAF